MWVYESLYVARCDNPHTFGRDGWGVLRVLAKAKSNIINLLVRYACD